MTTATTRITKLEKTIRARARESFIQGINDSFANSMQCAAANDSAIKLLIEARKDIVRKGQRAAEDQALEQFLAAKAPEVLAPASLKFESLVSTEFWHLDAEGNRIAFCKQPAYIFDPRTGLVFSPTLPSKLDLKGSEKAASEANASASGIDWMFGPDAKWHVCTDLEYISIQDRSKHSPCVNAEAFPDTKPEYYRASSVVSSNPDFRWVVSFYDGNLNLILASSYGWVRLCRGPVAALPRQSSAL